LRKSSPDKVGFIRYFSLFLISVLVMLPAGSLIIGRIKSYYYNRMEEEAHGLANSYAAKLETAVSASNIINGFLNEKISAASQVVSYFKDEISNKKLAELARVIPVDVIYVYNPQGEIISSSNGKYIGWRAYKGHPVYDFMMSGKKGMIGNIRPDSETGIYYKYGYYRSEDGRFAQIGVLSEKIHEFLKGFEIESLLEDIKKEDYVDMACFFSAEMNSENSSYYCADNNISISEKAWEAMARGEEYWENIEVSGKNIHQIIVPMIVSGERIGSLVIGHSTEKTDELIRTLTLISNLSLAIMFIFIFAATYSIYIRNKRLAHYAYYSPLTDLPNRRYYDEFLNAELSGGGKEKKAVMLVNLKNFMLINMLSGYHHGEQVIKNIANSLSRLENDNRRLFHLNSDRFVFYVKGYKNRKELNDIGAAICRMLREVLPSDNLGGSVGIIQVNKFSGDADILLKNASIAAQNAQERESFGCCYFNNEMEKKLKREEDVISELTRAAETGEGLFLEYQPIVELNTNKIYGFEALARLKTERLGLVSPVEFIPLAERTQLIVPLGDQVLKMACGFIKRLEIMGYSDLRVAVNISGIQLLKEGFEKKLIGIIKEHGVRPSSLDIEITESVFYDNYDEINKKLAVLKKEGMKIAIDDFGTGYSSLARQRELNINCLKIDKFFIDKVLTHKKRGMIMGDIISMAHKLGHLVIAEGVEEEEQRQYLIDHHCDCMQGYLFSKPLSEDAALKLLEAEGR
jgi:EAL domain-containing protein (putative c-di-GMP-specific phosphodiesterase class I)/GGDEF domain-containing protein